MNLETISNRAEVTDLKHHLYQGFGYGDDFDRLSHYVENLLRNMPSDANIEIIKTTKEILGNYRDIYEVRQRELEGIKGDKTFFQGNVRKFMNDLCGVEFFPEKQVRSAVDASEVTVINDEGIEETIKVHGNFRYDMYLELNRALKEHLGLDDKWTGIAVEAMGTYYHTLEGQIEADRKKRLISKDKNVILLEIKEAWNEDDYLAEILDQIEVQTGIKIELEKLNELSKYLGIKLQ